MVKAAYAHSAYAQAKLTVTDNPLELIIMLYDGAISSVNRAAEAIGKKDLHVKIKNIGRSIAIIEELLNSLDLKAGGAISANLQELYLYMMRELVLANAYNDGKRLAHIGSLLQDLKGAWVHNRNTQPAP